MKYHITSITPVNIISFQHVLHFGVGRSQIEWNMKVKMETSKCTGLKLNGHSNPYIESTTVLSDTHSRTFWPPGDPALRENVAGRIGNRVSPDGRVRKYSNAGYSSMGGALS